MENGHSMSKKMKKWTFNVQNRGGFFRNDSKARLRTQTIDENGELVSEKFFWRDRVYSNKGYVLKYNNDYMKLFFDRGLPEECTLLECGKFYKLIYYILGENQLLGYRNDRIRPLTVEKISKMFNCSERQTRRFINKMKDLKVIKEVIINDTKWYAVNPLYALKEKHLSKTTFIIFQEELIPILPAWVVNRFMSDCRSLTDKIVVKK